jgi:hypothetical protein
LIAALDVEEASIEVTRAKDPRFGDYASNAALTLAGRAGLKPRTLAEIVTEHLDDRGEIVEKFEVAGPGFINFFLSRRVWDEVLHRIHNEKEDYGQKHKAGKEKVLLEFVSANPTGPLHVGHGRGAAAIRSPAPEDSGARSEDRARGRRQSDEDARTPCCSASGHCSARRLNSQKHHGDYIVDLAGNLGNAAGAGCGRLKKKDGLAGKLALTGFFRGFRKILRSSACHRPVLQTHSMNERWGNDRNCAEAE